MVQNQIQQNDFFNTRKEYYIAGRLLCFEGLFESSFLLFGYTIEFFFKAGLCEFGVDNRKILNSHNLIFLLKNCQANGIFNEIKVSDGFLDYSNDMFNQRYPSQKRILFEKIHSEKLMKSYAQLFINAYDDYIFQLDGKFQELIKNDNFSIGLSIAAQADNVQGRIFFHRNAYALSRHKMYLETVKKQFSMNIGSIAELEKGVDYLSNYQMIGPSNNFNIEQIITSEPAKNFEYPSNNNIIKKSVF
jgi:hypothetical protein